MNIFSARERDLAFVKRWGITRNIFEQDVAQHSYFVTLWAMRLALFLGWDPATTLELVKWALLHDIREIFSGDQPSPYKKALGTMAEVNDFDHMLTFKPEEHSLWGNAMEQGKIILKLCDLVEAQAKIHEEMSMGNTTLGRCSAEIRDKIQDALQQLEATVDQKEEIHGWVLSFLNDCLTYESGISTPKPRVMPEVVDPDDEVPF